jgi:hypothetical protein
MFSYFFCLMIEGSGYVSLKMDPDTDPRAPTTYGSYRSGSAILLITLFFNEFHSNKNLRGGRDKIKLHALKKISWFVWTLPEPEGNVA